MTATDLTLTAPVDGIVVPLDQVPDPVFSGETLGPGIALDPLGNTLHAPCSGVIVQCARTRHAVTLRDGHGLEWLLHLGIDTVALDGEGIDLLVREDQAVSEGDPLCTYDIDALACRARALITPLVLTNAERATVHVLPPPHQQIKAGQPLLTVRLGQHAGTAATALDDTLRARRRLHIRLPQGIHARPAARLRALAQQHEVTLTLTSDQGQSADAKSLTGLLGLSLGNNQYVDVTAEGATPEAALDAVEALLASTHEAHAPNAGRAQDTSLKTNSDVKTGTGGQEVPEHALVGQIASEGIVLAPLARIEQALPEVETQGASPKTETTALREALTALEHDITLERDQARQSQRQADAEVFEAHLALVNDPALFEEAVKAIEDGASAAHGWRRAIDQELETLARSENALLRERNDDLRDVQRRLMARFSHDNEGGATFPEGAIVVADTMTPSYLVERASRMGGLALAKGGTTSHLAILARARGLPCLVGLGASVLDVTAESALLDAQHGYLLASPTQDQQADALDRQSALNERRMKAEANAHQRAITLGGTEIGIYANIGTAEEAYAAAESGADGIGLFRSEFLFLDRDRAPSAADQQDAYARALAALPGKPVIIRLLDIGADKQVPYVQAPSAPNPALGIRGVRLWQHQPELLETQLDALLRAGQDAGPDSNLHIMVPMVTEARELAWVRQRMEARASALGIETLPKLGAMIEVPSAALNAGTLAAHADFLSIGTNDLTQYTLAMDREADALASFADALHPAVLRLIKETIDQAGATCPVGVCGGAAAETLAACVYAAMGVAELSVEPTRIATLKQALRRLDEQTLIAMIPDLLRQPDAAHVRARLADFSLTATETPS
ncbi:phosphoenolpyruvate--protein phosphotransferase [Larsenimonas suaedae]|uniref:phosphoenolpyruvate--protein phosphotransferase n=1 Tax=Larsenimonas suaedae TaxID=1851019 RepID=A0ABU1GYQ9_9GAMM|nr:phosphoenolpyruvate--protein phosphotransferase [Larsenimonas suaedae]MCM2973682.1 phosphoenolpyruvate--protein phosphotransferase [Larsenimonas suaedae]MDR5897184.1 phosphoenolpyruvate--protein phosphotransferase [Larsenimonas suaedae]